MKRVLLYLLFMVTLTMCTSKQEAATDSTAIEAVDTVEAKTDTTVVIVDSLQSN